MRDAEPAAGDLELEALRGDAYQKRVGTRVCMPVGVVAPGT